MGNISGSIVNITPVFWSQNIVFVRVEDFVISAQKCLLVK